jgi:hypothetical protein
MFRDASMFQPNSASRRFIDITQAATVCIDWLD